MKKLFIILILFSCFYFVEISFNEELKLAEQGDIDAQSTVGFMYYDGKGVKQDYLKAFEWFKKAVEQGDAYAQLFVANMYYSGEGVKLNKSKALYYYGLACDNQLQKGCDEYARLKKEGIY